MERPQLERRVVDAREFGELVLRDLDEMLGKLYPNLREETVDLAVPFKVSVDADGGTCTCKVVCTEFDGTIECVEVCHGTGCG
jgi:hypothetical protein